MAGLVTAIEVTEWSVESEVYDFTGDGPSRSWLWRPASTNVYPSEAEAAEHMAEQIDQWRRHWATGASNGPRRMRIVEVRKMSRFHDPVAVHEQETRA